MPPFTDFRYQSQADTEVGDAARVVIVGSDIWSRTWDLLRLTRMPAVRVELGYLSNPADARRLTSPEFQDVVAEGLAAAVTRFCAPH